MSLFLVPIKFFEKQKLTIPFGNGADVRYVVILLELESRGRENAGDNQHQLHRERNLGVLFHERLQR